MNIAIIVERYDPAGGGAERSTDQIAQQLVSRGHRVTIFTGTVGDDLPNTIEVHPYLTRGRLSAISLAGFVKWTRQRIDEGGFDVDMSVTTAAPAAVVQPRSGTLKETFERNIAIRQRAAGQLSKRVELLLSPKRQMLLRLERATTSDPRVRTFLCNSEYVARQLREHYRVADDRLEILPNASVMPAMSEADRIRWRRDIRSTFHIADNELVCLFAAYNPRLKGLDTLLHALQQLQSRGVAVKALLAGGIGYGEQQRCEQLGVRDRVAIIGPTQRMHALYCAADLTVLPTWYDPSSKVVIESLMMGVPAISTRYNGASDLIDRDDGSQSCGRVISNPADAAELADAIAELADPAERSRCAAATEGLAERLSMKVHVDRLEQVLRDCAKPVQTT
jgi:UDP-glucose:(heptosyl)LPS alpha-1,3-glucosyltransferase